MRLKKILLFSALTLAPLAAQTTTPVVPRVVDSPLKQYLTLTDAQMTSLQQVQTQRRQAESLFYQQISEKQRQLDALLQAGSSDAANIGRLMVEINNLRRQLPLPTTQYRTAALAILTDAQKAKLPALTEALKLVSPASEAAYNDLIDRPAVNPTPRPMPLPMPVILPASADGEQQ